MKVSVCTEDNCKCMWLKPVNKIGVHIPQNVQIIWSDSA